MNLLFVAAEYPPDRCGGIGVFYQDLAHQLSLRGSRVTVVAPSTCDDGKGSDGDVTVHRWPGSLAADSAPGMLVQRLRFTRFVEEIAHELAPDLIETHALREFSSRARTGVTPNRSATGRARSIHASAAG